MKRRVVLLGPPGCGKGTVASQLQIDFGLAHVSCGHWLRREVELGTAIGRRTQAFLDKGHLVPDETVLEFMEQRLENELGKPGVLLDGFPRTLGQARALDAWLNERHLEIDLVLFYECSEAVSFDRITGRRVCSKCGRGYHIRNKPPQRQSRCDECGAELVQRDDDTEAVLRNRLQVYIDQTEPIVEYYREQGKLTVFDATKPSDAIYASSIEALKQ